MDEQTSASTWSGRRSSSAVGWACAALLVLGGAWQLVSQHGASVSVVLLLVLAATGLSLLAAGLYARSLLGSISALASVFSLSVWFFWLIYAAFLFVLSLEAIKPPPPGTQWFALVASVLCIGSAAVLIADGFKSVARVR